MAEVGLLEVLTFLAGIFLIVLIISVGIYVYLSIVTMRLAKKLGVKRGWLAWIPLANFYLYTKMAGMHWWPIFLLVGMFIPLLEIPALLSFVVFNYIWFWKILVKLDKPGWLVLLTIIPFAGWLIFLVILGTMAWSQETNQTTNSNYAPVQRKTQIQKAPQKISNARVDRIKKLRGSLK